MAEACVSLIPGVSQLLADKGYDTDAFRAFLKDNGIKPVIPEKSNRKKRVRYERKPTKTATWSSAASVASRTSDASPPATTSSPETSSLHRASSLRWLIGCDFT
jgi:IS5 family transposase